MSEEMAQDGPLVPFDCSRFSSEAPYMFLGIRAFFLPDFKQSDAQHSVKMFASRVNHTRRDMDLDETDKMDMSTELWSLWKNAVRPVLGQLNSYFISYCWPITAFMVGWWRLDGADATPCRSQPR